MGGSGMPIPVAALDNDRMALMAMRGILPQLLPGAQWLWGVAEAGEAVRLALAPDTRPRLMLVDMSLDDGTGVGVCRRIRRRTDRVLLLAVTAFSVDTYADRAAQAGAQGIVSKADVPAMAAALRTVAAGGTFAPAGVKAPFGSAETVHRRLEDESEGSSSGTDGGRAKLGAKETETLRLLARGLSYEQIAAQWGIAPATVRTHAHRAVDKLGAKSLAHAIAIYLSR
ncbi:DNA-binding response regulator [Bifidobacterium sp. DSM 109958]|uniref:DNA-binding response regulator n=2 Tax=Bifidobacterium moraviense TaxID=2675323 RepID=A0A7Y0HXQ0_9BIFI|nr:DNA-binding response regulator [Bifidobacterium sp. DSM 109958]